MRFSQGLYQMKKNEQLNHLIKVGLKGDKIAFARQAAKLAREYDALGMSDLANDIRNSIQEKETFHLQKVSQAMSNSLEQLPLLPIDQETKFDLADIILPDIKKEKPLLKDDTLSKIQEFILFITKAKELKNAGLGVTSSMILFGPPGCGKTMAVNYIASALNLPLITARCDALVSSYLGSTSKNIRQLFDFSSQKPCVLFLDELDALAKARDDKHELGELKRVVVSLLQNIDNLPEETILIAASNHENLLDSAVWRRFEYRIPIELPDMKVRKNLFEKYDLIKNFFETFTTDLALMSSGLSCSFINQCCIRAIRHAFIYNDNHLNARFLIESILEAKGSSFNTEEEKLIHIVTTLRETDSKKFTIRRIAKILELSAAKVSRLIKSH